MQALPLLLRLGSAFCMAAGFIGLLLFAVAASKYRLICEKWIWFVGTLVIGGVTFFYFWLSWFLATASR